jgi:hypothetical protein
MAGLAHMTPTFPADRSTAELRERIEAERQALDGSLDRLEAGIRETLDWRRQVRRHRGPLLAAAGGLALLGALRLRRRRSAADRAAVALQHGLRRVTRQAGEALEALRGQLAPPRPPLARRLVVPLAGAAVRGALAWLDRPRSTRDPKG